MSDTELRRNPDTGDVERKVVSYEKVEQAQLQGEVDNLTSAIESTKTELDGANTRVDELTTQLSDQEKSLESAKSQLAAYNETAGVEQGTPDSGAEGAEPAAEATDEAAVEGADATPQF